MIPFCLGSGCLLSLHCKRYHPIKEDNTEYFTDAPYRVVNGKTECIFQWIQKQETENGERGISETDFGRTETTEQGNGKEIESDCE